MDFSSKCDQISSSPLLEKALMENFIFYAVMIKSSVRTTNASGSNVLESQISVIHEILSCKPVECIVETLLIE